MTLSVWLHDLSPILIDLGPVPIRWYGLSYIAGFYVAFLLVKRVCRVGVSTLQPDRAADLVVAVAIGIVLGGRLGYVLLYQPSLILDFSSSLPFWGVLAINKGGMASHGGMLGGMAACFVYARRHGHPFIHLVDLFAFSAPLGVFFGRVANFINGELIGRPCDPTFPLAVKFPQELAEPTFTRLDEVYTALPPAGSVVPGLQYWDVSAIIDLIQRGNRVVSETVEPFLTPRHPSQLYAGIMEGLVVLAVLMIVWSRPRKPGVIAGVFAIVYAVMRIINEFFRTPDAHLLDQEFAALHVTRGQWLSAVLLVVGVVILIVAGRRDTAAMGGWREVATAESADHSK